MDMRTHQGAQLVEISAFDAWHLLSRADVARVAWYDGAAVSIVPVNYVLADGALWFRTTPCSAVVRAGAGVDVVVEVDHLDPVDRTGWSVLLRSTLALVDPQETPAAVSELCIWPEGPRTVYARLEPTEVTGRKLQQRLPR